MEGDHLLKSEEVREERKRMLHLPHILPLVDYLDSIKEELGSDVKCPMFDPCDGGINAKALFLQQDPGEKAVESGFISRNNHDQTAKNTNHLLHEAGFRREETILWNIVPWYVGTGNIKDSDIERAMPFLEQLPSLIEDLKVIILVGKKAQGAFSYLSRITELPILCSYHPSPLWINSDPNPPARYRDILAKFRQAKNILGDIAPKASGTEAPENASAAALVDDEPSTSNNTDAKVRPGPNLTQRHTRLHPTEDEELMDSANQFTPSHLCSAIAKQASLKKKCDGTRGRNWPYIYRPGKIAERVAISVVSARRLKVALWPGDTVEQARRFYARVNKEAFLSLSEWKVEPHLHFSFASRQLIWVETSGEARDYFDYFLGGSSYGQKDQDTLLTLAERWESNGLINSGDRARIEAEFTNTQRKTLNVIPGFEVSREWDLDEWEPRGPGALQADIVDALAAPLTTWGETLHADGSASSGT